MRTNNRLLQALCVVAASGLAGCEQVLLVDPAAAPASFAVGFSISSASAAGGPRAAYDKADSIRLVVFRTTDFPTDPSQIDLGNINTETLNRALVRTSQRFQPSAENRVRLVLDLPTGIDNVILVAVLTRAGEPLFGGLTVVGAKRGDVTPAEISLIAIPEDLIVTPVPTINSVGQSVQIGAAVLFFSGDTITGFPMSWQSSNPAVGTVDQNGRFTARAPGQTTITVTARQAPFSFTRSITVTVRGAAGAIGQLSNTANRNALSLSRAPSATLLSAFTHTGARGRERRA
jgi:hypothetical protein